ncbi:MAG: WG repeat-containing protein, partial [Pirellulales bacterium]
RVEPANHLGYAKVCKREKDIYYEGVIDAEGREIIPISTEWLVVDITDSRALLTVGRTRLFVDLGRGPFTEESIKNLPSFTHAEPYSCGLAAAMIDDRFFYVDEQGNRVFGTEFNFAESFQNNRAFVKAGDEYRIIDVSGKTVAAFNDETLTRQSPFTFHIGKSVDGQYTANLLNLDGERIASVPYDEISYFDEEVKRTRVRRGTKFGFVDEFGKEVIALKYDHAEVFFQKGTNQVSLDGRIFYIDPDGKEVNE